MNWAKAWSTATLVGSISLAVLQKIWIPLGWVLFGLARCIYVVTSPLQWLAVLFYHSLAIPINFLLRFEVSWSRICRCSSLITDSVLLLWNSLYNRFDIRNWFVLYHSRYLSVTSSTWWICPIYKRGQRQNCCFLSSWTSSETGWAGFEFPKAERIAFTFRHGTQNWW